MSKEEREKRRQLMRVAIPAAVCLVAIIAIALGTRVWQPGAAQGQVPPMELRGVWMGMRLAQTTSQIAADLGVPAEVKGIVVADVQADSRAVVAGLAPGDVLTRLNGKDVASMLDMYAVSGRLDGTRPLQVDFLRAGRPMTTNVLPPQNLMSQNATWSGVQRPMAGEGGGWTGAAALDPGAAQRAVMR
jgi:S1-C subfamily serine protease